MKGGHVQGGGRPLSREDERDSLRNSSSGNSIADMEEHLGQTTGAILCKEREHESREVACVFDSRYSALGSQGGGRGSKEWALPLYTVSTPIHEAHEWLERSFGQEVSVFRFMFWRDHFGSRLADELRTTTSNMRYSAGKLETSMGQRSEETA